MRYLKSQAGWVRRTRRRGRRRSYRKRSRRAWPEGLEIGDKLRAQLHGKRPKCFVANDIEAQVPRFGAILVENIAAHDLQAVRSQEMFIVIHDLQFHEHAFFDWIDKFLGLRGGQIFFFEPVGDREEAAGLQEFSGGSEELLDR